MYLSPPRLERFASSSKDTASPSTDTSSVGAKSPYMIPSNSIGSLWSVSMQQLKHATSVFEVVECLRSVRTVLQDIDRSDRMRFCKADYENAVKMLKKNRHIWSSDLFKETIAITLKFFDTSYFTNFPTVLLYEIILWLPANDLAKILCVCSEWSRVAAHNDLWKQLYRRKFLLNNPGVLPSPSIPMIVSYHNRLEDPQIGDKIEVAWKGKFRLETQDVYQGLAWWVAEVVDKHRGQGKYKIRYPGWESRWDEWVPRNRLRWTVAPNTVEKIEVGDVVELWCCGVNVPGAWLESKVKKIRNNRYCLGKVLSSGSLWVERDRLRLVRKADDDIFEHRFSLESRRSARFSLEGSMHSLSARLSSLRPTSCTIMQIWVNQYVIYGEDGSGIRITDSKMRSV